jgi:small subunit ribosomal protein S16
MIVIRLTRIGKKNQPYFRIVAAEKQAAVKGKFLEILGHWNPRSGELVVDREKLDKWRKNGAQLSATCAFLIEKKPKPFKQPKPEKAPAEAKVEVKTGPQVVEESSGKNLAAEAQAKTEPAEASAEEIPKEEEKSSEEASAA